MRLLLESILLPMSAHYHSSMYSTLLLQFHIIVFTLLWLLFQAKCLLDGSMQFAIQPMWADLYLCCPACAGVSICTVVNAYLCCSACAGVSICTVVNARDSKQECCDHQICVLDIVQGD